MSTVEGTVTVETANGLHVRTASAIGSAVAEVDADVTIGVDDDWAAATNSLNLIALNVSYGESVRVRATGPDAERAVTSVRAALSE